jgi:hypothetical protein
MPAHRKRKIPTQPLTEPHVRFLESHADMNSLCRVGAGSLWYMKQQVGLLGPGLLRSCVDRAGQAWRRNTNLGDEPHAVVKTWRVFAGMAVVQVFSAFDDFVSSMRAELDRWAHSGEDNRVLDSTDDAVASDDDDTELSSVDRLFRQYSWAAAELDKFRPALACFKLIRNCVVHRNGRASQKLADLVADPEHVRGMAEWPGSKAITALKFPAPSRGELIQLEPHHAVFASDACLQFARIINSNACGMLGDAGLVRMAAYHGLLSSDPIPVLSPVADADKVVSYLLASRYSLRGFSNDTLVKVLNKLGIWKQARIRYRDLYANRRWAGE